MNNLLRFSGRFLKTRELEQLEQLEPISTISPLIHEGAADLGKLFQVFQVFQVDDCHPQDHPHMHHLTLPITDPPRFVPIRAAARRSNLTVDEVTALISPEATDFGPLVGSIPGTRPGERWVDLHDLLDLVAATA